MDTGANVFTPEGVWPSLLFTHHLNPWRGSHSFVIIIVNGWSTTPNINKAKESAKATSALKTNLITLYIVVWGQYSEAMQSKIKNIKGCTPKKEKHNSIWLLTRIQEISQKSQKNRNLFMSLLDTCTNLMNCKQGPDYTVDSYTDTL
jgi:hypothetical protein